MIRRRYIPRDNYEVSFKKDSGIVFRKFSSTSAEEIHVDPRKHILWCYRRPLTDTAAEVPMREVRG